MDYLIMEYLNKYGKLPEVISFDKNKHVVEKVLDKINISYSDEYTEYRVKLKGIEE